MGLDVGVRGGGAAIPIYKSEKRSFKVRLLLYSACEYREALVNICSKMCFGTIDSQSSVAFLKPRNVTACGWSSCLPKTVEQAFLPCSVLSLWSSSVILRGQRVPEREELELGQPLGSRTLFVVVVVV